MDRNRALGRYKVLRNQFLRKKRRHWNNPGPISAWWLNAWNGILTEEENFRISCGEQLFLLKLMFQ